MLTEQRVGNELRSDMLTVPGTIFEQVTSKFTVIGLPVVLFRFTNYVKAA